MSYESFRKSQISKVQEKLNEAEAERNILPIDTIMELVNDRSYSVKFSGLSAVNEGAKFSFTINDIEMKMFDLKNHKPYVLKSKHFNRIKGGDIEFFHFLLEEMEEGNFFKYFESI